MKYLYVFLTLFANLVFAQNPLNNTDWKLSSYFYSGEYIEIPSNEEVPEIILSFENNTFSSWVCGGIVADFIISQEAETETVVITEMTEYLTSCSPVNEAFQAKYIEFFYDFEWNNGWFAYEIIGDNLILSDPYGNIATYGRYSMNATEFVKKENVSIYPNPAKDYLFINGMNNIESKYKIYSIDAQLMQEGEVINDKISIKALPSGSYILSLNLDNRTEHIKFLKH